MFYECSKLTLLNISSFDVNKVNQMENIMENCPSLKKIRYFNYNVDNL